jgi:CheY-like chemotaxis protein
VGLKKINAVFLIDDDAINNYINARLIKRLEIADDLIVSLNGREALNYLSERVANSGDCPSLILLDINMPVMDGFEFVNSFKSLGGFDNKDEVVIYMLTTSENVKDIEKARKYPEISGLLNKPLTEEKIRKIVDAHFSLS